MACNPFAKEDIGTPIARVNEHYLYLEDIETLITDGTSSEDSVLRVNNFINQWATEKLLIEGAILNLAQERQNDFEQLIEEYRSDLYINSYLEEIVKQNIDTSVTSDEATTTYQSNLESFKLNEELIKFRYINVSEDNTDINEIRERFIRFNQEDKKVLDSLAIQFRSYALNDSIWIKANDVVGRINVLNAETRNQLLKKSNFVELKDSLGVYLMQINDVRLRNETAPMAYVMPTIKQIVINRRKLEFIKQLETDITRDAIRNKQFEIYD